MLETTLTIIALWLIVVAFFVLLIHASDRKAESETFDLSPYRETDRDERTDNVVDLVERLRNASPRHGGVPGVRDNRQLDSLRTSLHGDCDL